MNKENDPIQISITFEDKESALNLAKKMVELKLIACAQIFPITSIFNWDNAVQSEEEYFIQAKTVRGRITEIEKFIIENHSYDVPEIIATPIIWGHEPYLKWLKENTK